MNKWRNLPNELLIEILKSLSQKDQAQCSLTCQTWRSPTQRALFENIKVPNYKKMRRLVSTLRYSKRNQSPGNFVKTMDCSLLGDSVDISLWGEVFPFLEALEIFATQKGLYKNPQQSIKEGKLPHLKKAPLLFWDKDHTEFVLSCKDWIQELLIRDVPHLDSMPYKIFQELHLFPVLNTLRFDCGNEDKTLYFEDLFPKIIPQLNFIEIRFTTSSSKISVDTFDLDLNKIEPFTSIREVKFDNHQLLSGGDKSYLYMMKKFPHLDKLDMYAPGDKRLTTRKYITPSTACLSQFHIYLFNIKKSCNVLPIITDESTSEIVKDFLEYVHTQQIYKNVEIHLSITLEKVSLWNVDEYPEDRTAYINFRSERCGDTKGCLVNVVYKVLPQDECEPYLELFQEIGDMDIHALHMGKNEIGTAVSLDAVFNYFTKLRGFRIYDTNTITISENASRENKSQSMLTFLHFDNCNISKEVPPRISMHCPKLKFLEIDLCSFGENGNRGSLDTPPFVPVNLSSLCLESLHFHISLSYCYMDYQYRNAFLRLRTATKRPRYCKLKWIKSSDATDFDRRQDNCTEVEYKRCLKDRKCIVYDIYCEEVSTFIVEVHGNEESKRRRYPEEEW